MIQYKNGQPNLINVCSLPFLTCSRVTKPVHKLRNQVIYETTQTRKPAHGKENKWSHENKIYLKVTYDALHKTKTKRK